MSRQCPTTRPRNQLPTFPSKFPQGVLRSPLPDQNVNSRGRSVAGGGEQNDLRPPNMYLRGVAIDRDRQKPLLIRGTDSNCDTRAHVAGSQAVPRRGNPKPNLPLVFSH